jgi:hypothetical protein
VHELKRFDRARVINNLVEDQTMVSSPSAVQDKLPRKVSPGWQNEAVRVSLGKGDLDRQGRHLPHNTHVGCLFVLSLLNLPLD